MQRFDYSALSRQRQQFATNVPALPHGIPGSTAHGYGTTHPGPGGAPSDSSASAQRAREMLGNYTTENSRQANNAKSMQPYNISIGVNKAAKWELWHTQPYFENVVFSKTRVQKNRMGLLVEQREPLTGAGNTRQAVVPYYRTMNIPNLNLLMKNSDEGRKMGTYSSFVHDIDPDIRVAGVQVFPVPEYNTDKVNALELTHTVAGFRDHVHNVWETIYNEDSADGEAPVLQNDRVGWLWQRWRDVDAWSRFAGTVGEHANAKYHYFWRSSPWACRDGQNPNQRLYNRLELDKPRTGRVVADVDMSIADTDSSGGDNDDSDMESRTTARISAMSMGGNDEDRDDDRMANASENAMDDGSHGVYHRHDATHAIDRVGERRAAPMYDLPFRSDSYIGAWWPSGKVHQIYKHGDDKRSCNITRDLVWPTREGNEWMNKLELFGHISMILRM